ncbi:MAG: hypothetical protein JNG86_06415 [Verrucomicrobiaceae bacterium]|nr:hypothetical protein [Verrucomicrobiaceae bacterium]
MLEAQKSRIHQISRLKAQGHSDLEARQIVQQQLAPFRPAFVNGKRVTERVTIAPERH